MTNVRLRLVRRHSVGMDMRYEYYAIREWSVQGTCMCNGHGTCTPREEEQLTEGKVQLVVSMVTLP